MQLKAAAGALVILSGGADSTICLHWALRRFETVHSISFDYGQRHAIELSCAADISKRLAVPHQVISVSSLKDLGGNALVEKNLSISSVGRQNLPNTFVPGRNLIFITLAAARAWQLGISELVTGVCQTDYSGYPDCRETTMKALEESLSCGMDFSFHIHTPLMHLSKAESIGLAIELDALESLAYTHTCYEGQQPPCGTCPSCELRKKGFSEAGLEDPLLLRFL